MAESDEISDTMYGVVSMAVYGSEYTAVIKDVSIEEIVDYKPVREGDSVHYMKPYRLSVELVQAVVGGLPPAFDLVTITLKFKPLTLSQEPYLVSFCKTPGGQYFVPAPLSRFKATEGVVAAAKEMAADIKQNYPEQTCVANDKFFIPLD